MSKKGYVKRARRLATSRRQKGGPIKGFKYARSGPQRAQGDWVKWDPTRNEYVVTNSSGKFIKSFYRPLPGWFDLEYLLYGGGGHMVEFTYY